MWTLVNLIDLVAGSRDQVKILSVGLSSGSSKWAGQLIVPLAYVVNKRGEELILLVRFIVHVL